MKVLPNIGKNDNNDISFPLRLRCLPTTNEPRLELSFFRPFPSFRACAIRTRIIARGNRVKSQREKVSGKVVKSEKSKGDKGLIPRGEEVLPTELTSLLTDVTRFFEPPRTPLLLRLVKHTCQRLAYPLVPLLARPKPSPKTIYTCIYHTRTYTVYVRGRSKEVGVGIGFRFRRWPRNEERSGARGEGGGRRRRRRRARNRLSNLEPSLDLNEIVSYVTAEWLALRSYVRGKRAITRLSFGRRFLIPPALTLISR